MEPPQGTGTGGATLRHSLLPPRYRTLDQIAVGGMASIWLAEDKILGRRVAVKMLAEQLGLQPLFVQRFEREARTAAGLSTHPNVITIYDVGDHEGRPFIVMEYLPGGTLRDRIRAGHVDRDDVIEWLRQASSALDFAHSRGVVHRDVKPQNLLLDDVGRLVIADLGIARAAYEDSLTASGELLGTASYISPEQAAGQPATAASDRYSLAVVAYELTTGSRPFGGGSFAEQALRQIESEPERPSARRADLPQGVDDVLLKGLAKQPSERWPTAGSFVDALAEAFDESPTATRPERPPPPPTTAGTPRFPARLAAVTALVLALVAGGVVLVTSGGGGSTDGGRHASGAKERKQTRQERAPVTAGPAAPAPASAPASGAVLNERGYGLMRAGRYDEAIPVLERAVAAFPKNSTDLTYAYALYNLGRSLRLAGRAPEAIPYLERRLGFANQRDVVQRELEAARRGA